MIPSTSFSRPRRSWGALSTSITCATTSTAKIKRLGSVPSACVDVACAHPCALLARSSIYRPLADADCAYQALDGPRSRSACSPHLHSAHTNCAHRGPGESRRRDTEGECAPPPPPPPAQQGRGGRRGRPIKKASSPPPQHKGHPSRSGLRISRLHRGNHTCNPACSSRDSDNATFHSRQCARHNGRSPPPPSPQTPHQGCGTAVR